MNQTTYHMLDPTAELSPEKRVRRPPPARLEDVTIGLLSISKERSSEFLDTIERLLTKREFAVARFTKGTHTKPAPESVVQAIVESCGVVVVGLAD
jgi:hypothetical protein